MKKFLSLLVLLCLAFSVAGCGEKTKSSSKDDDNKKEERKQDNNDNLKSNIKTLTCINSDEYEGDKITYKAVFSYDEDKKEYTEGKLIASLEYAPDTDKEEINVSYNDAQEECDDNMEDEEYVTSCKVTKEGNKITQTTILDLTKYDSIDLKENDTLEKLKEYLDEQESDYTCTID